MAISGIVSSSSREIPYAPASVSGSDVGTARAYNNASTTVSFTAPVHDGGLPVTSYEVTSSPGGLTASGSSSPLTITGLSSSTSYTYSITATNAIGTGPSITSGSVFATTIPQPVTIGTATATGGAGTISIGFTPNGTGGKTVTYTATASPGGATGSSSGSPISVSGLSNGTSYTFTVVASNANGSAAASAASNSATPYTYVPPTLFPPGFQSAPVASASGNSVSSTSGSWANGSATSFIYKLYIGQSASGTFVTSSGQVTQTSYTFTGLSYSTNYYVLVEAYNGDGGNSALSNTVTTGAAPPACVTPGSMSGRISASYNTSTQTITWSWTAPSPIGSNNYYQYSINGGTWYSQLGTSVTSSAGYGTYNTIQVYASEFCIPNWNDGGTGSASITTESNPVVAPGSMSGRVSGSYSNGLITFSWSAPTGTAPFTYYYSINGYSYNSTNSTSYSEYGDALTITVYASNAAGSGGSGSASAQAPAPAPYRYYCRTSAQCAGIGNCSDNGGSTNNQTGSGSGYSIACLYNNTGTYPACQSTASTATCTGNLSCCSEGLKYQCSNYDVTNVDSINYWECYFVGQCNANYDPAGVRTLCCPPKC